MPLSFGNGGTSNYKPYVKYMASTSSWANRDGQVNLSKAVFDLANIKTGWCLFTEGGAPEWVMDASLEAPAARPDGEGQWKRGFKVHIFSKAAFGDEEPVAEWATNGAGATMSIQALYAEYEAAGDKAGQVPVVEFSGSVPTKLGKGSTTIPTLKIVSWVDRPSELDENGDAGEANTSFGTPAASADDEF
jgi:hypothetical protein